jgi:hypothetical protein
VIHLLKSGTETVNTAVNIVGEMIHPVINVTETQESIGLFATNSGDQKGMSFPQELPVMDM